MQSNTHILRITFLYFAFGFTWIFFTDKLLHLLAPDLEANLQTYKGWFYILGTTLLLFLLLKASQKKLVISKQKIELKDRVIAQTEEEKKVLEKLSDELREANEELQAFNYSVSHDLKSPLRVIQGYAEILYKRNAKTLAEDDVNMIAHISSSVKRINGLIGNLLSFSATGRAVLAPEQININTLFEDAVMECRAIYPNAHFEVNIYPVPTAYADKILIRQVVSNITSNAFKYSSTMPNPAIEIGTVIDAKDNIYYIKDNGTGFDMQFTKDLFTPFKRWHSNTEFDGNGVGLAIAERIMQKHEGKIWAESVVGQGSIFYFSLPISTN